MIDFHFPILSLGLGVFLAMLQPEDRLEVVDLGVGHDLLVRGVADVQQLAAEREHTVLVPGFNLIN